MERGEPDKQALEAIRKTEQALALRHAAAQKKAAVILARARIQAEDILRRKEEDLAQTLRLAETMSLGSGSADHEEIPLPELDLAARKTAEKIADSLFKALTAKAPEEGI
ncbi:MAG: hypothetical protein OEZ32_12840 [Nitrospinota bacterium]|nr:hypothetical protein [Nitrospinota bacterium]